MKRIPATLFAPDLGRFEIELKSYVGGWAGQLNEGDHLVAVYINPAK